MPQNPPVPWRDVPGDLASRLRPRVAATADDIVAAVRAEVPEYDQPLEGEFGRLITDGVRTALDQFVDAIGTNAPPASELYAALGRAELEAGRTLDALQSAYRTGARVAWRAVVGELGTELDPATMYVLAEAIFAYIDRLAAASVAGYTEALAEREGSVQERRQALVERLLDPLSGDEARRAAAAAAGWPVPATVAAVALDHDDPVGIARGAPDGTLGARTPAGSLLVVPDPAGPGRRRALVAALAGVPSAIGPAVEPGRLRRSADRAARTLALPAATDAPRHADDHRIELLLAADPDLAADLADAHLGPLRAQPPGAARRSEETLRAWLDAHADVSAAAVVLHVHPQTVRYRLAGLRDLLGDAALDDPRRRLELELALRASA